MTELTPLKLRFTQRGFVRADFDDLYGNHCSIQESSLATDYAIWFGVHEGRNGSASSRMHLNQEQVALLLPLLEHFVKTGLLQERNDDVEAT